MCRKAAHFLNMIVIGIGKVGYTVAEQLTQEGHDVTIIDTDESVINDTLQDIDVIGIIGSGSTSKTLKYAGVEECDMVIALTGSDEVNILCCLIAKKLGAKNTIARVRDPIYADAINIIKDDLGLSMHINPELAAANEIARLMLFPQAILVETFAKGRLGGNVEPLVVSHGEFCSGGI
jgi:trk system potassium uptake protein TrkA